jgi:hypothetical protein
VTDLVSVIIPSYNHERFVAASVESVLRQEGVEVEVIVCDDSSTDGTLAVLQSLRDPRLKVLSLPENLGASVAAREAHAHATGKYIARLSSDDICLPGRLVRQVEFLRGHPQVDAVFGQAEYLDEAGEVIPAPPAFAGLFASRNRTREEWLQQFFDHGNCLCLPSAMVRRSVSDRLPQPGDLFRHLPDFEYWVRFCLAHEIHILPEKLVGFRVCEAAGNLSAPGAGADKWTRRDLEEGAILRYFLQSEGLAALGLPGGMEGRLQLAERALAIGGRSRTLFAQQLLIETVLDPAPVAQQAGFLARAHRLLEMGDALGLHEIARLRAARDALKSSRDQARMQAGKLEAELRTWKDSWVGRLFGRFIPRPSGGEGSHALEEKSRP